MGFVFLSRCRTKIPGQPAQPMRRVHAQELLAYRKQPAVSTEVAGIMHGTPHFVPHSLYGLCAFLYGQALFLKQVLQLTRLEHLADDIAAADEFSLNVELRDGRPIGIGLD